MAVEIAAVGRPRKMPWKLPRISVVIAALPWPWPRMAVEIAMKIATAVSEENAVANAADFRGLPWLARRSLPRTEPRRVPCGHNRGICRGSAMSRVTCLGNPSISTVARGNTHGSSRKFRGHCHGPPPKSQIVCIRGKNGRATRLKTHGLHVFDKHYCKQRMRFQ